MRLVAAVCIRIFLLGALPASAARFERLREGQARASKVGAAASQSAEGRAGAATARHHVDGFVTVYSSLDRAYKAIRLLGDSFGGS